MMTPRSSGPGEESTPLRGAANLRLIANHTLTQGDRQCRYDFQQPFQRTIFPGIMASYNEQGMPNRAIEFHDSMLNSVAAEGSNVILHLSPAYIHESEGEPGQDPGSGWSQDAHIHIERGLMEGDPPELPCDLSDGELHIDGDCLQLLPIPFDRQGRMQLDLQSMTGNKIRITGTRLRLEMLGIATYLEEGPRRNSL